MDIDETDRQTIRALVDFLKSKTSDYKYRTPENQALLSRGESLNNKLFYQTPEGRAYCPSCAAPYELSCGNAWCNNCTVVG